MAPFTQAYALLIGVDEHSVPAWSLPAVAKDLKALHAVLIHPERCAYPADHVRVLQGSAATRPAILAGLDWLHDQIAADTSGNATAFVYYSGHGWRNQAAATPTYYLIPHDTQPQGTGVKATTALRADEFAEAIAALTPQRLLVVLDCCHAAGLDVKALDALAPVALPVDLFLPTTGKGPTTPGAGGKGVDQLAGGHGRAILSSSQGSEQSYIRADGTMSIFTYHLIEALTGHAQPSGGATEVLVSDILSHVHRRVPASAQQQHQQPQQPDYKLTGNFAVARLLGGKGLTDGQPAPDPLAPLPPAGNGVTNHGRGALAQGSGVAAGERGIAIGGNATGNQFITGDNNQVSRRTTHVNTGGGTYVDGNVNTGGGDFVGRNKSTSINTAFDQRGQTVSGGQTNIAGDLHTGGGIFNSGQLGGAGQPQPDLAPQLRQLLAALTQAGQQGLLAADRVIDAEGAVRKALRQAEQARPDRQAIRGHLLTARAIVEHFPGTGALLTLIDMLNER